MTKFEDKIFRDFHGVQLVSIKTSVLSCQLQVPDEYEHITILVPQS